MKLPLTRVEQFFLDELFERQSILVVGGFSVLFDHICSQLFQSSLGGFKQLVLINHLKLKGNFDFVLYLVQVRILVIHPRT
ncbi:hypothetical protein CKO19_06035 [Rhodovulum adriaticum]|nr:hypothetical protein [Rhodovulum adriaticum]